ncbi:MAG: hypothetical protein R3Y53_08265 [Bacillota bacterium]
MRMLIKEGIYFFGNHLRLRNRNLWSRQMPATMKKQASIGTQNGKQRENSMPKPKAISTIPQIHAADV